MSGLKMPCQDSMKERWSLLRNAGGCLAATSLAFGKDSRRKGSEGVAETSPHPSMIFLKADKVSWARFVCNAGLTFNTYVRRAR